MTASRTGGCGCGGAAHTHGGCGCSDKGARTVLGGCSCAEPERCGVPCLERPVYSAGQLLTADALRLGQRYLNDRLALRRYVDGVGIACGMYVRCDPQQPGWIVVEPGYAVDACGNDVALCEPVRFDLCKAIAECPRPQIPCDDDVQPTPRVEVGPVQMEKAFPSESEVAGTRQGVLGGTVTDRRTGKPVPGAVVRADGTSYIAMTSTDGGYTILVPPGDYTLSASMTGYRVTTRPAMTVEASLTPADFVLVPHEAPVEQQDYPPPFTRTFVLRAEAVWEGREPVAVVTRPGSADPRPECRDSREAGSIRLCVQPLNEPSPEQRASERRHRFRQQGRVLFERLAQALDVGAPPEVKQEIQIDLKALRVAEALLRWVRENPPRSVCGAEALLCELRRAIRGEPPKCSLPDEVRANPAFALVQIVGQLVDDLREGFLSLACDDCVVHPGVRLAHVVVDDTLAGCSGTACHIAGVDTHPPAREALHPAGSWWRGDRVALYDAYFRPVDEAGVLLTSRGLRAFWRDAAWSGYPPDLPWRLWEWMSAHGGGGELRRLGVYQQSELYATYSTEVVMWTVEGRVVSIEPWNWYAESAEERFSMDRYLQRPLRAAAETRRKQERAVSWEVTPSGPGVELTTPGTQPPPMPKSPAGEKATAAELAALDPAPLRELIRGIGPKTEAELFRHGIRTLTALEAAEYEQVHDTISGNVFLTSELFRGMREQAREYLSGARTVDAEVLAAWTAAARKRLAALEGRAS
jgi:predicted flap endonuclease-1-like 5' DNA nuclease